LRYNALYTTVAKLFDAGISDFEMKDQVAAAGARWSDWPASMRKSGAI
jgi:hypothetical protein